MPRRYHSLRESFNTTIFEAGVRTEPGACAVMFCETQGLSAESNLR
jgi:hypothetical protein